MKKNLFRVAILSSVLSFVMTVFWADNISEEFHMVMLYPLLYGLLFMILWTEMNKKAAAARITVSVFLVLQWLRLVLLPALGAISGYFTATGGLIDGAAANTASGLVLYECLVTFLAAFLILNWRPKRAPLQMQEVTLDRISGNPWIYLIFVLFAALLFVRMGANMYSFFTLDVAEGERAGASGEGVGVAISAIIDYGLTFLVILLIYFTHEKYKQTGNKVYMYLSLLVALARICIIQSGSDGRLAVLYPIVAFLLLLPKLYSQHKKLFVRTIVLVGVAVLGLMTVYKVFHAFFYDSYLDAIKDNAGDFDLYDTAQQIDIYFYGVRTVAQNLYVSQRIDLNYTTLAMDYLRNTFGVHYLIGDTTNTTIAQYNLYIYRGESASGYLYSALVHGATYFTVILAPLMTVGNMVIAAAFEKWLQRIRSMDSYYIISVVYIRLVYNMFACFPMGWNYASRTLILGALVVGGASLFKSENQTGKLQERYYQ